MTYKLFGRYVDVSVDVDVDVDITSSLHGIV